MFRSAAPSSTPTPTSTPVVISQVQTNNDETWVKTRQRNASASGVDLALEEHEAASWAHGEEIVGWLALEAGVGNWNGMLYEAGYTSNVYPHLFGYPITFDQNFAGTPRFLAALASYNGADPARLRYTVSAWFGDLTVWAEEDTTSDTEDNHLQEEISYLALEEDSGTAGLTTMGGDAMLTAQTTTITRTTYTLAGQPIAVEVEGDPNNDGIFYVHTDHLGSVSAVTNASGNLVGEVTRFYLFGDYFNGGSHDATDRGFTGHRHNDELDLIYMNARYYLPGLGRFVSADTLVPEPAAPQSFNRYAYALNNPVKYMDPSGHKPACPKDVSGCEPTIPPPTMPDPALVGFTVANTDPLPLAFYQHPGHFQMTAGVEYYMDPARIAANLLTPLIGQGGIPDVPGVPHEGYPALSF